MSSDSAQHLTCLTQHALFVFITPYETNNLQWTMALFLSSEECISYLVTAHTPIQNECYIDFPASTHSTHSNSAAVPGSHITASPQMWPVFILTYGIKRYGVEINSNGMISLTLYNDLITGSKVIREDTYGRQTEWWSHKLTFLLKKVG
jgi:hypothetical protein